jgi:hypothetical protein
MIMDDFYYYKAHQEDIIEGHIGEFVVIKDCRIEGYYKDDLSAFADMKKKRIQPGRFMLKKCKFPGTDTIKYYTNRVRFG